MLEFLRRYQHNIMIVVAIAVIVSFAVFFNPYDPQAGRLVGADAFRVGSKAVSQEEIQRQARILRLQGGQGLSQLVGRNGMTYGFSGGQLVTQVTPAGEILFTQNRIIVREAAQKLGIEVSEEEVDKAIRENTAYQKNGAFDAETYNDMLKNNWQPQGLQPGDLRNAVADGLLVEKTVNLLASTTRATPTQVELDYQKDREKITASVITFNRDDFEKDLTISDEQIKTYFDQLKAGTVPKSEEGKPALPADKSQIESKEKRQVEFVFFEQPEHPSEKRRREEAAKAAAPPVPPTDVVPPVPAEPAKAPEPSAAKDKAGNAKKGKNTPLVDDESEPPGQAPPAAPAPPAEITAPALDLAPPAVPTPSLELAPPAVNVPGLELAPPPAGQPGAALGGLGQPPMIDLGAGAGLPSFGNPAGAPPVSPEDEAAHKKNLNEFSNKVNDFYVAAEADPKTFKELAVKFAADNTSPLEVKTTPLFSQAEPPAEMNLDAQWVAAIFGQAGTDESRLLPVVEVLSPKAGYYVGRVIQAEKVRELTLEEAKAKLTETLKKHEADKKLETAANEARTKLEEALKIGKKFDEAAKELALTVRAIPAFEGKQGPAGDAYAVGIKSSAAETVTGAIGKLWKSEDGKVGLLIHVQEREAAPDVKPAAAPVVGNQTQPDPEAEKKTIRDGLESRVRYSAFEQWLEEERAKAKIQESAAVAARVAGQP